jgi:flagellar biosynthesis/type III secretory pathway chaperone
VCACASSAISAAWASGDDNRVLSDAERIAIINAYYKKKIQELVKNKSLVLLYTKGQTAAQINKVYGITPPASPQKPNAPVTSGPSFAELGSTPANPCAWSQAFYVRRDRLDTFQLREKAVTVSDAKGASVSYTANGVTSTNTLSVNGRVGTAFLGPEPFAHCVDGKLGDPYTPTDLNQAHIGYSFSPFVDAQGTTNTPKSKTESSALQGGVDLQTSVFDGPLFDHQYFIVTPYYQTDFRGLARVEGAQLGWEPVAPAVHLGGRLGVPNPYIDYFFQFRAEADFKDVQNVGTTGLAIGAYRWIGGTGQLHVILFPDIAAIEPTQESPFPFLVNRLYANGKIQYYWNEESGITAHLYEGELGYNFTPDGKTSMSFKYDNGLSKDTLIKMRQYLLSLNYKY